MSLTTILITAAIVGALFAYLWWQGQIRQLVIYCQQTWEELKKCSWPTWDELKGSTAVIVVSILLLGGFTVVVDVFLNLVFHKIVY